MAQQAVFEFGYETNGKLLRRHKLSKQGRRPSPQVVRSLLGAGLRIGLSSGQQAPVPFLALVRAAIEPLSKSFKGAHTQACVVDEARGFKQTGLPFSVALVSPLVTICKPVLLLSISFRA